MTPPRSRTQDRRNRRFLVILALLFFTPVAVSFYLYYGPVRWRPASHVNRGDLIDPARPLPEVSLPLAGSMRYDALGNRSATAQAVQARSSTPTTHDFAATHDPVPADLPAATGFTGDAPSTSAGAGAAGPVFSHNAERLSKPDFLKGKWTLLYVGAGNCSAACRTDLYNTRQVRAALNRDMDRVQRVFIAAGDCCDWPYLDAEQYDLVTLLAAPAAAPLLALLPTFDGVAPLRAERVYLVDPLGNLMMSYGPAARPKGMLEDIKRLLGLSHVG